MKKTSLPKYPSGKLIAPTRMSVLFILLFMVACKKFVQIDPSPNEIPSEFVFDNDATAKSSVLGLYSSMMQTNLNISNGGLSIYNGLSADEIYNPASVLNYDGFFANNIPVDLAQLQSNIWSKGYNIIYQANACIEGLDNATNLSPANKAQLLGEAKFIRAFTYFNMVNLFGAVPLVTGTDYKINEILPRTAPANIYGLIISDLTDARSLLLPAYPSAGAVRANRWAATALLARVYLYQNDWVNAEALSTEVISSGPYTLVTNLNNVFLADSKEAILQLIPVNTFNSAEGATFIPTSATVIPPLALSQSLLNAFEPADQRKVSWIAKNTVAGIAYNYPFKYKIRTATAKTEYNMVLRLAEQYLIRAEARAQLDKLTGTNSAQSDLNIIRSRAGLLGTGETTKGGLLLAVEKERRLEYFCEWGHRWFDLKRTGRIDRVLSVNKTAWDPTKALYPIPYLEIQRNQALTQNEGYEK